MEDLIGFILEFIVEVLIQLVFEAGVDAASRAYHPKSNHVAKAHRRFRIAPFIRYTLSETYPPWTILKFTLFGVVSGFLSLLIVPHPLVHASRFHGMSLLISPLVTGLIMALIGRLLRRHRLRSVNIESFAYGFTFAFAFSVIRILTVH